MATVLAISLKLDPTEAVGVAVPFALLGQYGVTTLFTIMSPLMAKADRYAEDANPKGIVRLNYFAMVLLGLIFASIVTLFFIGGQQFGDVLTTAVPKWFMSGLGAAGGMMRFVGFAILLRVMVSRELWGFYFMGFALSIIISASSSLDKSALLILALIGFGFAYWDFQVQTKFKKVSAADSFGGEEDGI